MAYADIITHDQSAPANQRIRLQPPQHDNAAVLALRRYRQASFHDHIAVHDQVIVIVAVVLVGEKCREVKIA